MTGESKNSDKFKAAMRKYGYSVSVVSNMTDENKKNAITISSFTSISVLPPSILICINKSSKIHNSLSLNSFFCVNLLNDKQKNIAELCSNPNKYSERFENNMWTDKNPPKLKNALAHLVCKVEKVIDYNTHSIITGSVQESNFSKSNNPLLYLNQEYVRHRSD